MNNFHYDQLKFKTEMSEIIKQNLINWKIVSPQNIVGSDLLNVE
jgi:hypothetical protein